jgi:ferredoxin-type protein NapH
VSGRALPLFHDYDFDEEESGFGEPEGTPPPPPLSAKEKLTLAAAALGLLSVLLQLAGAPHAATWLGVLSGFPLAGLGLSLYFWVTYKDTTPGIKHDGLWFQGVSRRGIAAWILGVLATGFYVCLYWWPEYLQRGVQTLDPLSQALTGGPANQWFLYGYLYSLAVLVFGVRTIMKYRHNRYQVVRTISVVFFQLGFAFLLPQLLKGFRYPEFYPTYFWPLKYDALIPPRNFMDLWNQPGGVGAFMAGWGLIMTFVATPVLTYFFGKRWYCSWVCGCGGLAETAGDPFRQLSDKSDRAWTIERWLIHSVLVLVVLGTAMLWAARMEWLPVSRAVTDGFAKWYGFFVGSAFAGVIGVGFYPLLGSRVWCRFGCPMAAVLGIFQRVFSRFRITTNGDQCMSCGNCSTYCEMGIDVRSYAEKGQNIVRASCVGCGVCAAVCPRGVLKLENGPLRDRISSP